jgi:hypothetical protein
LSTFGANNAFLYGADGGGENTVPSSCVIKPIRNVPDQTGLANLHYNPTTFEVSWGVEAAPSRVYMNGTIDAQTFALPGNPVFETNHVLTFTPLYSTGLVAISSSQVTLNPNKNYRMVFQLETDYFYEDHNLIFSLYAHLDGVLLGTTFRSRTENNRFYCILTGNSGNVLDLNLHVYSFNPLDFVVTGGFFEIEQLD